MFLSVFISNQVNFMKFISFDINQKMVDTIITNLKNSPFIKKNLAKRYLSMIDSVSLYTYLKPSKGGFLSYVHISGLK